MMVHPKGWMHWAVQVILFVAIHGKAIHLVGKGPRRLAHATAVKSAVIENLIEEDNFFYENLQKPFSWEDPELVEQLWRVPISQGTDQYHTGKTLKKRTPGSDVPLIPIPSCLKCANIGRPHFYEPYNVEWFTARALDKELRDKCLFYTRRVIPEWNPSLNNGRGGLETGLSDKATEYACRNNRVTIWVSQA
jgi:hypothetical protein